MRPPRRALFAPVSLLLLATVATVAPAATSAVSAPSESSSESFQGIDGRTYTSAPQVVDTQDGDLYFGPDFDAACAQGALASRPMKLMTKLAKLVERSGRRVVWTGAPSKASVLFERLSSAQLPHGRCDRIGLREQTKAIDSYRDPTHLPMTGPLSQGRHQVYWRTDPHWTTVGGAIWARAIGARLDPRLGRRQRYHYGSETAVGLLNSMRGIDTPETLETAMPAGRVRSRTAKDSVLPWDGYPQGVTDYAWVSRPARLTWPGRTLVFGDSFSFFALPNLLPLFRHGRFMWIGAVDIEDAVRAIKDSDTVVFEVYQTFLQVGTVLTSPDFRRQVRRALR